MKLGDVLKQEFMKIAAILIILLSLFNVNNALTLMGSPFTPKKLLQNLYCFMSYCDTPRLVEVPVADATITITPNGYSPSRFAVKAGSQVKIHLVNSGAGGCTQAFTIPSLNLQKIVPPNSSDVVTFTAPDKPGPISFMCSMGMYEGTINVI
jgi:hypothetical protein